MLGVDRSGIFRLIAAKLLETIKIRLAAHNGRVHPPRRSPERGGRSS
jgi:hypothetical protein